MFDRIPESIRGAICRQFWIGNEFVDCSRKRLSIARFDKEAVLAMPNNFGNVQPGNGFVQYFPGLSVKTAPLPNFAGNTTLAGRFTGQVVVDKTGNIIAQDPIPGTTGNLSIRFFEGPANLDTSMALTKSIRLDEKRNLKIRADAINFLNKPQWGDPNTNITSANFGRITTATGARTITFNARLEF